MGQGKSGWDRVREGGTDKSGWDRVRVGETG